MSVIAGNVSWRECDKAGAGRMRRALDFVVAERMADWADDKAALHVRRRVVDDADRVAPLLVPQVGGVVVAVEGHLYNGPELAADLSLPADSAAETLIAAAWRAWGDGFPRRLNGEFALAAWDPVARRLLLATDHVGTVPLYWTRTEDGRVVFATELAAIVADTGVVAEPDWEKVADLLANAGAERERTYLRGVAAIAPGAWRSLGADGDRGATYWDFGNVSPALVPDPEGGRAAFRAALEQAVARRLPGHGTVGAHLTGGLDSSAVAALAARRVRATGGSLQLYSIVAHLPGQGPGGGDIDYIPAFLRDYPECGHRYIRGEANDSYPLPGLSNGPLNLQLTSAIEKVTRLAQADGVRVMLSGWGGEAAATYIGYGVHLAAWRRGNWRWLWQEMQAETRTWRDRVRWWRGVWFGDRRPMIDRGGSLHLAVLRECLRPEFLVKHRVEERCLSLPPMIRDSLVRGQVRTLASIQRQGRFAHWAMQGRAEGFRYRYPLLDRVVLETVRSLRPEVHIEGGRRRALIRRALADVLPREIANRPSKFSPTTAPEMLEKLPQMLAAREEAAWPVVQTIAVRWPPAKGARGEKGAEQALPGSRLIRHNLLVVGEYVGQLPDYHDRQS